jgi:hypothetical protein
MRISVLLFLMFLEASTAGGQDLIGQHTGEIRHYMKTNRSDMYPNEVKNTMFSYLKYTDNAERQTILFFLDGDSVCSSVRIISDRSMRSGLLADLDSQFKRTGDMTWIDFQGDRKILVRFTDEKWSCTITYENEKSTLNSGGN